MNKTFFVQMYMRWGNTVTSSVKIYNFSVIIFTTSLQYISLYKFRHLNSNVELSNNRHLRFFKLKSAAGRLC